MLDSINTLLNREFKRLNRIILALLGVMLVTQTVVSFFLYTRFWGHDTAAWFYEIIIANIVMLSIGLLAILIVHRLRVRLENQLNVLLVTELHQLRSANDRAKSLQAMASTLSATLSFERVVEQALDVCSLALADMGIPRDSLVGAVFLYNGAALEPLAMRRFLGIDEEKVLLGKSGVVGTALKQGEPSITDNPSNDPELKNFEAFQTCLTVVCVPLRAGFQLFGVMVMGTDVAVRFEDDHFDLFTAVADQTVIALQNAQLYQNLEAEKQRLIEANEDARKELARDLHDGPTQTIAAIAMRLSAIRLKMTEDQGETAQEIKKVEEMAKRTSKEIRGMLFTLRPLLLESKGLGAAVQSVMNSIQETDGVEMQLTGSETGNLLNDTAQTVVFSIIEEALSNARKYAAARVVEVRLWQEEDLFVARITDDGAGFDPDAIRNDYNSRGSLGLLNMHERAERIDGSISIESAPGAGTTVTLVVPLEKQGRSDPDVDGAVGSLETAV